MAIASSAFGGNLKVRRFNGAYAGETLGATGDFNITDTLEIVGTGLDTTIIDAGNVDRAFATDGSPFNLKISDVTIRNGKSTAGGAIAFFNGTGILSLESVRFIRNQADAGGAVFSVGAVTATDSEFLDNLANSTAGALYLSTNSPLNIFSSIFEGNVAVSSVGGAVLFGGNGNIAIEDSTFDRNTSFSEAGALYLVPGPGNLTISDSDFSGNTAKGAGGSVLYSGAGNIAILRSNYADNTSQIGGAALLATGGAIQLEDSLFFGNKSGNGGGAIYASANQIDLNKTDFMANTCTSGPGGAGLINASGPVGLVDLLVSENHALGGGGFLVTSSNSIEIIRSDFVDNSSSSAPGGGIYASNTSSFLISDSSFDRNITSNSQGGGLYRNGGTAITIEGSTFSNNQALGSALGLGGAILHASSGVSEITNSTISGNTAARDGGGIYSASPMKFVNTTFTGNEAGNSGASILATAAATFVNTILHKPLSSSHCAGVVAGSDGGNLSDDVSCALNQATDKAGDAILATLGENGGRTKTHKPLVGSPAIDGVDMALSCPAIDQRKVARPFDGDQNGSVLCDIGSYESRDACPFDDSKEQPGVCGCGIADADDNLNGIVDCLSAEDLKAQAQLIRTKVSKFRKVLKGKKLRMAKVEIRNLIKLFKDFASAQVGNIQASVSGFSVRRDLTPAAKAARRVLAVKNPNFAKNKRIAKKRLSKLINKLDSTP